VRITAKDGTGASEKAAGSTNGQNSYVDGALHRNTGTGDDQGKDTGTADPTAPASAATPAFGLSVEKDVDRIIDSRDNEFVLSAAR